MKVKTTPRLQGAVVPGRTAIVVLGAFVSFVLVVAAGCAGTGSTREDPQKKIARVEREHRQRQQKAQKTYLEGVRALDKGDLSQARTHFTRAIALDPCHGAAHNDLGVVYYKQGRLYDAAVEFDDAAKNTVDRHEPFYNLGTVFEDAGQLRKAAEAYQNALRIAPGEVWVMENLARTYVKLNTNHQESTQLLEDLLLKEEREDWRHWIKTQLYRLRGKDKAEKELS